MREHAITENITQLRTDEFLDLVFLVRSKKCALARVLLKFGRSRVGVGALGAQGGGLVSAALGICRWKTKT